jgi:hypothetical protein
VVASARFCGDSVVQFIRLTAAVSTTPMRPPPRMSFPSLFEALACPACFMLAPNHAWATFVVSSRPNALSTASIVFNVGLP